MEDIDPILLNAANAAAAALPKLEAEQAELSDRLQKITHKIMQYKNIIASAGLSFQAVNETEQENDSKRAKKGECMTDIGFVLSSNAMSASDIQKTIKTVFGKDYGFSTIHSNLTRGMEDGYFKNANGIWSKV